MIVVAGAILEVEELVVVVVAVLVEVAVVVVPRVVVQ